MTSTNRQPTTTTDRENRAHTIHAIAHRLATQPHNQVPYRALAVAPPAAVIAAIERLHQLGFVRVHHGAAPAVAVLHRRGLERLAGGEPLPTVAADVERDRPVTVIRTATGWAAWHLPVLLLPAAACEGRPAFGAAVGATPDEAVAALQHRARLACSLEPLPLGE